MMLQGISCARNPFEDLTHLDAITTPLAESTHVTDWSIFNISSCIQYEKINVDVYRYLIDFIYHVQITCCKLDFANI